MSISPIYTPPFWIVDPYGIPKTTTSIFGTTTTADPLDKVVIGNVQNLGSFTAQQNTSYAVQKLFQISGFNYGDANASFRVGVSGDAKLFLNGVDVTPTDLTSATFTATQYAQLVFVTGTGTSTIEAVARNGTNNSSQAVVLTADATVNKTDISVAGATDASTADAVVQVASDAAFYSQFATKTQPTITTTGNFTASKNTDYAVQSLFTVAGASYSDPNTKYEVAVRGDGKLFLNGVDVTPTDLASATFTASDFAQLVFHSGTGQADIVAAVKTATGSSQALQITADASPDATSVNAAGAIDASLSDAATQVASNAAFASRFSTGTQPTIRTVGNFQADQNAQYAIQSLIQVSGASYSDPKTTYQVAVRGDGKLYLNGTDVTPTDATTATFTSSQFAQLVFQSGTGKADIIAAVTTATGSTQAVQVSADATLNHTSVNAAGAFDASSSDPVIQLASDAAFHNRFSTGTQPTVSTVGSFQAQVNTDYAVQSLFTITGANYSDTTTTYRVAVRGGGKLYLNGTDVTPTDLASATFTADQFAQLVYRAGFGASDIAVAVKTATGSSAAVQITADSTPDQTSLNAAGAVDAASLDPILQVASDAAFFNRFATGQQPTIATIGNFTASQSTNFALQNLFQVSGADTASTTQYRVAVRGDATLQLNGIDVTPTDLASATFTASEFAQLVLVSGTGKADIALAVKTATGSTNAVGISLDATTNSTSINAAGAIDSSSSDVITQIASDAAFYNRFSSGTTPTVSSTIALPSLTGTTDAAFGQIGTYVSTALPPATTGRGASGVDFEALFGSQIGSYRTTAKITLSQAALDTYKLLNTGVFGFQQTGSTTGGAYTLLSLFNGLRSGSLYSGNA